MNQLYETKPNLGLILSYCGLALWLVTEFWIPN